MCTSRGLAVWEISLSNFSALPFSSYYWHFRIEAVENCTVKVHRNCLSKSSSTVQSNAVQTPVITEEIDMLLIPPLKQDQKNFSHL